MSTDARTQTGQAPPAGATDAPDAGRMPSDHGTPAVPGRQEPQTIIQESIKYRRRAQDAERRAEALETEVAGLRQTAEDRAAALEAELGQARTEAETLRGRLDAVERDHRLERELVRAGCADAETALALARERLADQPAPEDAAAFAKALLDEKPHLAAGAPTRPADRPALALPPRTAGAKPAGESDPRRAANRLALRARETGTPGDVMAYMRARRGTAVPAL
ncbi:MAG: hypothetical protein IMZ66_09720 [Planctomycetes bacterium]|nr:hypothetical protein [Planctomycetota bacterium]